MPTLPGRRRFPGRGERLSPDSRGVTVAEPEEERRGQTGRRTRASGRAGRDLPVAVGVSLLLGGAIIVSLYTVKTAFLGVLVLAIGVALVELTRSLGKGGIRVPAAPIAAGGLAMLVGGYLRGPYVLLVALAFTILAILVWRMPRGSDGYLADVSAGVLVSVYAPFLAAFAALLLAPPDGPDRVLTFVVVTTCSDIGGYFAGAFLGRHPMAPKVSPKKTWEGFAGSALFCMGSGAALAYWLLGGQAWEGVVLGAAVLASATLGDLAESMVKRDLGIKDMGALLPGHGGIMDRLDSLLVSAPVVWLVLSALIPPT